MIVVSLDLISCDKFSDSSVCVFNVFVKRRFAGPGLGGAGEEYLFVDVRTEVLEAKRGTARLYRVSPK